MRVHRAPGPVGSEAEPDKRGRWYLVPHQGLLPAQLKLVEPGAAGLHEHERADLPGGAPDQHADADADADTGQFLGVSAPNAVVRAADAVVFTGRERPDADGVRHVDGRRPVERLPVERRPVERRPVVESV
jgi:hypothetical protein